MPCSDPSHGHNDTPWPAVGELIVHQCENICGYCPQASFKPTRGRFELLSHVYRQHLKPANKREASHPDVRIKGWSGQAIENARGRDRAARATNRKKTANNSLFGQFAATMTEQTQQDTQDMATGVFENIIVRHPSANATDSDDREEVTARPAQASAQSEAFVSSRASAAAEEATQVLPNVGLDPKFRKRVIQRLSEVAVRNENKCFEARLAKSEANLREATLIVEKLRRDKEDLISRKQNLEREGEAVTAPFVQPANVSMNLVAPSLSGGDSSLASGIADSTSSVDTNRSSAESSAYSMAMTDKVGEENDTVRAPGFNSDIISTPAVDHSYPLEMPGIEGAAAQTASTPTLDLDYSREKLQELSDAALERQNTVTNVGLEAANARLEESRARLAQCHLLQSHPFEALSAELEETSAHLERGILLLQQSFIEDEQQQRKRVGE